MASDNSSLQYETSTVMSGQAAEPITYKVDKMTFLVTPVYQESPGKTIHELLLNLMESNSGIH